jgi:GNAT superfamily N-acetyltransferase
VIAPTDGRRAVGSLHELEIRPIGPADATRLVRFHESLSPETQRLRFFGTHPHLTAAEIERFTTVDGRDRDALVALLGDAIVAVARFDRIDDGDRAEAAFVVADEWQGHGLGAALFRAISLRARRQGITRLIAFVLHENHHMLELFRHTGLPMTRRFDGGVIHVELDIEPQTSDE